MSHADAADSGDADRAFLRSLGWVPPSLIEAVLAMLPLGSLTGTPAERRRWLLYAVLQHTADARRLDSLAWASDERLAAYLGGVADGELPGDPAELGPWLKHLLANRAKKHFHRWRLLERFHGRYRRTTPPRPRVTPLRPGLAAPYHQTGVEQADAVTHNLARVRSQATPREWHLLRRAASERLHVIAESEGLTLGTLKSLLSRCRARLRQAALATRPAM
jgi:hypothetical protein